jgi:peroxin-11B
MVVDTLVHHPTVAHYLRFVATTVGRDKVLRTLQYLARFLSWYLLRKGYTVSAIAPWEAMKKNFGAARKVMRIGKNIEHLKAASVVRISSAPLLRQHANHPRRPSSPNPSPRSRAT